MTKIDTPSPQYIKNEPFLEQHCEADPFEQFSKWFTQAHHDFGPQAIQMVLGTVSAEGYAHQRIVNLKEYTATGFVFVTNYHSQKAKHISAQPMVSLLFWWPDHERQVRIQGCAQQVSASASAGYFSTRKRESQIAAWVSPQSDDIPSRQALLSRYDDMADQYHDVDIIPCPEFWGGFQVVPTYYEFWQGGDSRLHDRIQYTQEGSAWVLKRLAP